MGNKSFADGSGSELQGVECLPGRAWWRTLHWVMEERGLVQLEQDRCDTEWSGCDRQRQTQKQDRFSSG